MMTSKMRKLTLAVGVALGGVGLLPSVQAMNLATDGLGQVLIFPYYTVRGGWATLFNITNTSGQVVAAKVRFHESYNSRDVFDFNIILSPRDVWNGWVADTGNGPAFYTEDLSCTAPAIPASGQPFYDPDNDVDGTVAYTGDAADGGPDIVGRMNEGYMEVIMMGAAALAPAATPDMQALPRGAVHANGAAPTGCGNLVTAFSTPTGNIPGNNYPSLVAEFPLYNCLNPLKGSYNLVNAANGWTAAGSPTVIANFSTGALPGGINGNTSLMTTQLSPGVAGSYPISFHEPSLNSGNTRAEVLTATNTLQQQPLTTGGNNVVTGVAAVTYLLSRATIANQWSRIVNSSTGWSTESDWVVNFPTKSFFVDNQPNNEYSARFGDRMPAVPTTHPASPSPFTEYFDNSGAANPVLNGESCVATPFFIWNREEVPASNASFSPGSSPELCYEANVLTFLGSNILDSAVPKSVTKLPGDSGWMSVSLAHGAGLSALTRLLPPSLTTMIPTGVLPVVGFEITRRDTGDGTLNEAFLIDHAYTR